MIINGLEIQGLTNEVVSIAKEKFGQNKLNYKKGNEFFDALKTHRQRYYDDYVIYGLSLVFLRIIEAFYKNV